MILINSTISPFWSPFVTVDVVVVVQAKAADQE